jgi:MSHA pilin protein MshA
VNPGRSDCTELECTEPEFPPSATRYRLVRWVRAFTLVEFLVGILFLATVLALAVPRLWNMGSEARAAKQQAIYGSVRAAAQITRAAARVHNQLGASGLVEVDGMRISTVYGYPSASAAGIIAATGLDTSSDQITLVNGGAQAGNSITIALNGSRASCSIVYTAPDSAEALPRIDMVNGDTSGSQGC